ncbi:MAG: FecR domain-containing protein [Archangiaceae bacterium]|nr:FecR domain-containing protein [Archangiaceae bacterium]
MTSRTFILTLIATGLLGCPEHAAPVDAGTVTPVVDAGAPPTRAAATLEKLTGTVTLTRKGVANAATKGPLQLQDIVETAEASNATLVFPDGREIELGENGRIEIGSEGDGLLLNVGQGIVVSRQGTAAPSGPSVQLSLDTPYGLVRVGSAGLSVNVTGDETTVDVLAGDVTLVGREGGTLSLEAGAAGSLSKKGANRKVTLEPLTVLITQGTGRIELKKKDGKAFTVVNPKKAPALAAGDTLRVTNGAVALTPEKSDVRVTLSPGTEVGIGESVRSGGAEDVALDVKKGQLVVALPFGKKRTIRPGDGVTLVAEQGGQVSIVRGKNGLELSSTVGDVVVTTETGQSVTVKGGQTASIGKAGVEAKDVTREALQLPTRQGVRLLHPGQERVSLVWSGDDDKGYRLQLGTDATLAKPLVDGIVHQTFFNTLAPARGALFWKVLDGETEVGRGSVSCGPEKIGDELDGITNEVPAGPDKTVIYFQDKPPALTFTWKTPEKPVAEYLLKVYRAGNLSAPVQERRVSTTTAQLPHGSIGEGKYQWDVTWLDAKGTPIGTAGKMNQLELNYDNAVRSLVIKAPRNGDAPAAKVAVAGIAPMGVKVSANGQALALDAKARFSGQVTPLGGNRIAFRVVLDGAETIIVRWLGRGGAR